MNQLRILGGADLRSSEGRPLDPLLTQPKRLALLAYLTLANSTRFRRRDTVVGLFWPELDAAHARGALRQALSFLRRTLGEGTIVTRGEEEVGVNPDLLWCDAVAFDQAFDEGRSAEALELYAGDLLQGWFVSDSAPEFERWLDGERARLRRRAVEAGWMVAAELRTSGEQVRAAAAARRAAALLPDDESELNRLILFLDELGDRGGALSAFEEFARRLREDYDAAPSPETEALVGRIRKRNDSAPSPSFPAPPANRVEGPKGNTPPAVGVRRRRVPAAVIGLGLLVVLGLIGLVGRANHFSNDIIPSGRVILVLPLSSSQPDTALTRLGRDLAATVSAALDGVGGLRTVDGLTALALTAECGQPCRGAEATRIARDLGATSLVRGTLYRTGNATRVDFEMEETDGQRTIVRGSTSLPEANLDALTDTVAWTLLRGIWRYGEPPSPSLGAVTTRKLPALRAFLEGEGHIVAGHWQDAARAYRAAMIADPGFLLAYQRFLLAEVWLEEEPDSAILDSLRLHRKDLPAREALLVEAWLAQADRYDLTLQLLGDAVTRFPDHWPAWFMYGDGLAHFGGMHGYPRAASRTAFRRAVALHPGLIPAWSHLFLLSAGEDTLMSGLALERLQQLGWFTRSLDEEGGSGAWFRLMDGLGRSGGVVDSSLSSLADDVAGRLEEKPGPGTFDLGPEGALWLGFPQAQIELEERARRLRNATPSAASIRRSGYAWAARGAWQSALSLLDAYAHDSSGLVPSLEAYRLAAVGAWLGVIDPADAVARSASIPPLLGRTPPTPSARTAQVLALWLDGLLAFRLRDPAALRRSQHALDSIGT
ncbi:MAG TPA: BTAD domain-containing putative transcriptional regulator, partial [Gemmatimonadales bacterium]|nr:BTAD domain-containing putative transcriptional regulator [Gemmatimonadales bacterium]